MAQVTLMTLYPPRERLTPHADSFGAANKALRHSGLDSLDTTPTEDREFLLFIGLPPEIRAMVWEYTLPQPDVFKLLWYEDLEGFLWDLRSRSQPPTALWVCHESREIALRRGSFFEPLLSCCAVNPSAGMVINYQCLQAHRRPWINKENKIAFAQPAELFDSGGSNCVLPQLPSGLDAFVMPMTCCFHMKKVVEEIMNAAGEERYSPPKMFYIALSFIAWDGEGLEYGPDGLVIVPLADPRLPQLLQSVFTATAVDAPANKPWHRSSACALKVVQEYWIEFENALLNYEMAIAQGDDAFGSTSEDEILLAYETKYNKMEPAMVFVKHFGIVFEPDASFQQWTMKDMALMFPTESLSKWRGVPEGVPMSCSCDDTDSEDEQSSSGDEAGED
ncbi:hypothetical protein S40293_01037 [Stachybotrys chartarum IBT 40293]|nr:hypothetical protein S40293_01037 [Stachybotrys chartarum IBT 40293]